MLLSIAPSRVITGFLTSWIFCSLLGAHFSSFTPLAGSRYEVKHGDSSSLLSPLCFQLELGLLSPFMLYLLQAHLKEKRVPENLRFGTRWVQVTQPPSFLNKKRVLAYHTCFRFPAAHWSLPVCFQVDIRVRVKGGGYTSQIYAVRQAIAKAIVAYYQKCEYPAFA